MSASSHRALSRLSALLAALACALWLAACATAAKSPSVTLAGVDIESIGLLEQRYVLQLRVSNPNAFDIPVEGLSFAVDLNGKPFGNGVSNAAVTIPRFGEAMLAVRMTSNLSAFLKQWREAPRAEGGIDYRVQGKMHVRGYGELPFDKRGEVALPAWAGGEKRRGEI